MLKKLKWSLGSKNERVRLSAGRAMSIEIVPNVLVVTSKVNAL